MKLPNAAAARVDFEKLTEYLLSETHPIGRTKATFFHRLRFARHRPEELLAAFVRIARSEEVVDQVLTRFGTKYVINGTITGAKGSAVVRTVWLVERTAVPKLVTAYPARAEGA